MPNKTTQTIKQIAFPTVNGTALLDSTKYVWTVNGVSPDPNTGSVYISNVDSATVLKSYRNINGTPFNGSANITTQYWGTARNIAISDYRSANTGPATSVNGSTNVVLKLPTTIKANIDGNCTGSSGSCTGNAATATYATNANHAKTADSATNANHAANADNATNANHAKTADTANRAYPRNANGGNINFHWEGKNGQPTWLWGGEDGTNMYVYNPAAFSVNHATTADSATNATRATSATIADSATNATHATTANRATNANHAKTSDSATNATNATNATKAMNDGNGANIAGTYVKLATPQTVTAQHNFSSGIKINGITVTVEV